MNPLGRKVELLERAAAAIAAERERAEAERVARLTPAERRAEAQRIVGEALGRLSGAPPWPARAVEEYWAATGAMPAADETDRTRGWLLRSFVPAPPEVEALARGASKLPTAEGNAWLIGYASAAWPRIVGELAALATKRDAEEGKPPEADALSERNLLEAVAGATDNASARLRSLLCVRDFARLRRWRSWVRALCDLLEAYRAEVGVMLEAAPSDPAAPPDPDRLERLWTWAPDLLGELRFRLEEPGEPYRMEPDAAGRLMPFPVWFLEGRAEPAAKAGA